MRLRTVVQFVVITLVVTLFEVQNGVAICLPGTIGDLGTSSAAASHDPNALTGPAGYGDNHFVPANISLAYRIDFENDAVATVPAQQVDIINQLEETLDLASFRVTEVGFGDTIIVVPPGTPSFSTTLPMTYNGVIFTVQISVNLDMTTGIVAAHFYSIDPVTGWSPPVDIGFLPPEDGTGRGMGYVSYVIDHKESLAENSQIRNVALITFDLGEQIYTNQIAPHDPSQGTDPEKEAPVIIDRGIPVSSVTPLDEISDGTFILSWGGSDSASGIFGYDIYTRDAQEVPWHLWLERTTASSAEFLGAPGHTHEFYSVAIDNVGHREQKDPVPEAKTYVQEDPDNDGILGHNDNCPFVANSDQLDTDADMLGDVCDDDDDNDQVADVIDNCPLTINIDQANTDGDSLGNVCDLCPLDAANDVDGDGICGDIDNCPVEPNVAQNDLDHDGFGDICDPQTCGNGITETIEKCDDSNTLDGDGCSALCISETTITISKAEIEWDDGKIKYKGELVLPVGLSPSDIIPQAALTMDIADLAQVVTEDIVFATKGSEHKKWEVQDRIGGLDKFKIDWKGAKFRYKGLLHLKANHIGQDTTSLEIERKGLVGAFSIQIGTVIIQVGDDGAVTTLPATLEVDADDDDGEIEVDLPIALAPGMTVIIGRPGQPNTEIAVADYFSHSFGRFEIKAKFNTTGLSGLDLPPYLKLTILLGEVGYPGSTVITSGWKTIKAKEWKYKKDKS